MSKFSSISREMIIEAIEKHDKMSEDELNRFGTKAIKYYLICNSGSYPVKRLIRLALNQTTKELSKTMDFNAIEAKDFLDSLGFKTEGEREPREVEPQNNAEYKNSNEHKFEEGNLQEQTGLKRFRNGKLVKEVKKREGYTCQACGFHYNNKVVHAHHLIPISNYNDVHKINPDELIVLCPTCHAVAHHLLRLNDKFQQKDILLTELKKFK